MNEKQGAVVLLVVVGVCYLWVSLCGEEVSDFKGRFIRGGNK